MQIDHAPFKNFPSIKVKKLLGMQIFCGRRQDVAEFIIDRVHSNEHTKIYFVNAHSLNIASVDSEYRNALENAVLLCDGIGVGIAAKILTGSSFPDNLNGTDFLPFLFRQSGRALRVYLLGGQQGVAASAADAFRRSYPNLCIVGHHHGYFSEEDDARITKIITDSRPDILLVAMGNPKQEVWVNRQGSDLSVPVVFGVGGLFDFVSGRAVRAPMLVRRIRCEWIWRLCLEPRRMFKRYVIGNPVFLLRVARAKLAQFKIE